MNKLEEDWNGLQTKVFHMKWWFCHLYLLTLSFVEDKDVYFGNKLDSLDKAPLRDCMDYVAVQTVERVKQIYFWVCLLSFYDNSRLKMYNAALHFSYAIQATVFMRKVWSSLIKVDLTFHT